MVNYCKYCDPKMSFGNDSIYKEDEGLDLFIANDCLRILERGNCRAKNIDINYCPMCGRKLEDMED